MTRREADRDRGEGQLSRSVAFMSRTVLATVRWIPRLLHARLNHASLEEVP